VPGTATLTTDRPGQLEIEVDCPAPQLLVVAESYHSGWHAAIGEAPQPIYRINGDFMGCVVGPGKSTVTFRFQPDSLKRGWLASYLGLSLIAFCFVGCKAGREPTACEEQTS
jgi:uncharacterized membrane protein YfhO